MHLTIFITNYPFVDWYKRTQDKEHSQYFSKRIGFWTWWLYQLWECFLTQMGCAKAKSLWMAWSKMTGRSFLVLIQKWHKLKITVANVCCLITLITPHTHPGQWLRIRRCVASWKYNCVWFADPTFPESKSKTEVAEPGEPHGPRTPRSSGRAWSPTFTFQILLIC